MNVSIYVYVHKLLSALVEYIHTVLSGHCYSTQLECIVAKPLVYQVYIYVLISSWRASQSPNGEIFEYNCVSSANILTVILTESGRSFT